MLTGELKSKIDQIWNAFWSGGIANPIEVIERITYLHGVEALKAAHRAALTQRDALFASL